MEPKIIYEVTKAELTDVIQQLKKEAIMARFSDRLVSVATVCEIHNVHRDTVLKYTTAKRNPLPHIKNGKLYKYRLSEVLEFDFNALRQQE